MKNLMKSIRITLVFCVFFSVCYILVLWIFAQFAAPGEGGNAETVKLNGKVVGVANVGKSLLKIYFSGADLHVRATDTMVQAPQAATRVLPMRNILQRWKQELIHFWFITPI